MKIKFLTTSLLLLFSIYSFSQEVRIAGIGDYGSAMEGPEFEASELAVANLVKSWDQPENPLDAIITVGDNNYPDGLAEDIETNIGQFYGPFILGHPDHPGGANRFYPSIGNHDYSGTHDCALPADPSTYIDYFELPGNEFYYDYVIGNVHFFVVDSDCHQPDGTSENSVQAQWLETEMTNSPHPWKIVYLHHAPYASEKNGSTGSGGLRWNYKAWGATAVLGGHYHFYERFLVDDLLFFVNGVGGNDLHEMLPPPSESKFQYNQKHGAMLMTFTADQANFKMINIDNEIIDNYTISLGNPCAQLGGDTDKDGFCNDEDCAPNDPLLPALPGFSCDDNNPFTINDVYQTDSCSCAGSFDPNGLCIDIPNFTKLGQENDHAYFRSENTASGWDDAQLQSEALGGYLLSIEDQGEKDFIDQFITGEEEDRIYFIGLSRNQNGDFIWSSDHSLFNSSSYSTSPWSGGNPPSDNDFVTMRKWNPNSTVNWGAENGNASRRFIIERPCSMDCSNEGGDSDGDGICDNFDCSPNDSNFPKTPGTDCDDNNSLTIDDIIQSDGCTCHGVLVNPNDCSNEGGDSDGDGICDDFDCAPNDSNFPITPGTDCDDNNSLTIDDIIQADGCTCQGVPGNPNKCYVITGFTEIGIFEDMGYYISQNNASGWEDAVIQSIENGGHLLSIETQEEKKFIDQFISGTENNKIFYIGLSRNVNGDLIWSSDNSLFNQSDFEVNPWEGNGIPQDGEVVTLRKWNTNAPVKWGTESGHAYRRFIMERVCSNDCSNEGGDSDGDGICDNQDCDSSDPNLPTIPTTACDDGNPDTVDDVIQEDGCTCLGEQKSSIPICDEVTFSTGLGSLTIENITAPISIVKVYDDAYNEEFVCINDCATSETITDLVSGIYHIEIRFFNEFWEPASVCKRDLAVLGVNNLNNSSGSNSVENITKQLQPNFSIYPNPATDQLFIKFLEKENSNLKFKIYNSLGQLERQFTVNPSINEVVDLTVNDLKEGIYFISYQNKEGRSVTKRFIIQK